VKAKTRLLKKIIRGECWKARYVQKTKQEVRFEKFIEFVTTLPLEGLGSDVKTLERLCHDDEEALLMLSDATIRKHGGDRKSEKARDGNIKTDNISLDIESYGTSRSSSLCRLRKDRTIPGIICALLFFGRLSPARSLPTHVSGSGRVIGLQAAAFSFCASAGWRSFLSALLSI
jgi:hypothetical protein